MFSAGFGNDTVTDFDAVAAGGQDLMDISAYNFATFAGNVVIEVGQFDGVGALDTKVTIGADTITLLAVNGVGQNAITQADFIL